MGMKQRLLSPVLQNSKSKPSLVDLIFEEDSLRYLEQVPANRSSSTWQNRSRIEKTRVKVDDPTLPR